MFSLLVSFTAVAEPADFYLSTRGNDAWSGTLAEPNSDQTDGPFATIQQAQKRVRNLQQRAEKTSIVVQIRGGEYRLDETVIFDLRDSRLQGAFTSYQSAPGEKPIFHSDLVIKNWKKPKSRIPFLPKVAQGKVWIADLPQQSGEFIQFHTLFDDEGLLPRARSKGFVPRDAKGASKNRVLFPTGMMRAWGNLSEGDVELVVRPHHAWIVNILPVTSVDIAKQYATTEVPATYAMNELHFLKGQESVWVENVIDALDQPGEWVLDSKEGKIYLWPRDNGTPQGISAPQLQEYLRVEGEIDLTGAEDRPVENLHFEGLSFTRGETYRVSMEDKGLQHDWEMHDKANALVRFRGTQNCLIEGCHFFNTGGTAIRLDLHSQYNKIQGNKIEHIGATGILVCGYGPGTKDVSHHNLIDNNEIHHVGKIYPHAPGIFLWQSGENLVTHNLVHHTPYSGIIISGVVTDFFWKKRNGREVVRLIRRDEVGLLSGKPALEKIRPFLHSHDNLIENNEIHHAVQKLNDGNGIYIRGCGAGNIIRRNYVHDLLAPTVMQSSIRTDGGQRDTLITENVIFRCVAQGMQIKLNNRAINNIIYDIRPGEHLGKQKPATYFKLYEGPLTGGAYQRNILYHLGEEVMFYKEVKNFRVPVGAFAKDADTNFNIYFSPQNLSLSGETLAEKQSEGIDQDSLAQDPLFVEPAQKNFLFRRGSPAKKLGITEIDLSQVGLRRIGE